MGHIFLGKHFPTLLSGNGVIRNVCSTISALNNNIPKMQVF